MDEEFVISDYEEFINFIATDLLKNSEICKLKTKEYLYRELRERFKPTDTLTEGDMFETIKKIERRILDDCIFDMVKDDVLEMGLDREGKAVYKLKEK